MTETNKPVVVNVDEVMAKIRREVARRKSATTETQPVSSGPALHWDRFDEAVASAEQHAGIGHVPLMEHRHGINRTISRSVARAVLFGTRFLITQQRQFNLAVLQTFRYLSDNLRVVANRTVEWHAELKRQDERINNLQDKVTGGNDSAFENRLSDWEAELKKHEEQTKLLQQDVHRQTEIQQVEVHRLEEAVNRLAERIGAGGEDHGNVVSRLDERIRQLEVTNFQLKTSLMQQDRRIGVLLEEARRRLPSPFDREQLQLYSDEEKHQLDALYITFEDQFRGTRNDIKERTRVYLPMLKEAEIGTARMPILDVGSGRGEWLELLKEEEMEARGVDINPLLVAGCNKQGLHVAQGDLIQYLRTLPDSSLGAVTGFHIIEHLGLDALIKLLDETVRVLKSGGVAIFETPNPANVLVGSCNFYLDPTHQKPLPADLMKFLVEARGLCRVKIKYLHPYPNALESDGSKLMQVFKDHVYGPQDYAVIGYRI
jgi:O-antigen chain-terminating methyltransferase